MIFSRTEEDGEKRVSTLRTITFYLLLTLISVLAAGSYASGQSDRKVVYSLLLDNSGSLRSQLPQVKAIGKEVVERTHQRGPVTVFNFITQGELAVISSGVEWTQDKDLLDKQIDNLAVTAGRTTLLDSIHSIAEKTVLKAASDKDKIIILITDGEDRRSTIPAKALIRQLRENGFKVYAVGLVQNLDNKDGLIRRSSKERAIELLTTITKETGGRVVFPKSSKDSVDSLLSELLAP